MNTAKVIEQAVATVLRDHAEMGAGVALRVWARLDPRGQQAADAITTDIQRSVVATVVQRLFGE